MEDRYIGCMLLHALGDTIGFKNSDWEFKQGGIDKTLEKLYEFIDLGGINCISLEGWRVSDDTILHMKTAQGILENFNNMDQLCKSLKKYYLEALDQFQTEGFEVRYPGLTTIKSLKMLKGGACWDNVPYDFYSGGSGGSMRNLCLGLAFNGLENRHKLIQISIETSRMTHNSAIGYLGGFASALFTALAIENEPINNWPFILLDLFKDGTIEQYIRMAKRDVQNFVDDGHIFIEKWDRYVNDKFNDKREAIKRKSGRNLVFRGKYYGETFGFTNNKPNYDRGERGDSNRVGFIGSGGDDSVIIAYDCLIDSGDCWEKLVIYSMLHSGDTDTTGAIAGGLYGALYGFKNIPSHLLDHIEYKDELIKIGKELYQKYYSK
jgi:ADP-ribosylglycohydrolase